MKPRIILSIVGLLFLASLTHAADAASERKDAAQNLAAKLSKLHIHKIYVFDFVDASGESCLPCTYIF
jgi:hypothetical protein